MRSAVFGSTHTAGPKLLLHFTWASQHENSPIISSARELGGIVIGRKEVKHHFVYPDKNVFIFYLCILAPAVLDGNQRVVEGGVKTKSGAVN